MSQKKVDWSKGHRREALIWQRQGLWREDTLRLLAAWLGLEPGMTALDVGCGLGYLGYTWWPFFGRGGRYIGVDSSEELIADAQRSAREWADGGQARFICGDAYDLPVGDNSVDVAMCQTVLMHLDRPEDALREMARIVKPGGLVFCCEPDNLSAGLSKSFSSAPEFTIDEEVLFKKMALIRYYGRLKLGRGDLAAGAKMPYFFDRAGLTDIDIRVNDNARFLLPPYDSKNQRNGVEQIKKWFLDEDAYRERIEQGREEFLAGGGDPDEYESSLPIVEKLRRSIGEQLERGEFHSFSPSWFYIGRARKPV